MPSTPVSRPRRWRALWGTLSLITRRLSGLYQIASQPISKYELLVRIRDAMKLDIEVQPYDDPPCDRSLSASRFVAATDYRIPGWDGMIAELAADLHLTMIGQNSMGPLEGKRVLVTGGTGSLGQVLVRRLLTGEAGAAQEIMVFSRDEAKQHAMRVEYKHKQAVTDEIIYRSFMELLQFRIGDVRDFHSLAAALRDADLVFNAAALKQVPTCEYFPYQAVMTNIAGPGEHRTRDPGASICRWRQWSGSPPTRPASPST